MRVIVLAIAVLFATEAVSAEGLREYVYLGFKFAVSFPAPPKVEDEIRRFVLSHRLRRAYPFATMAGSTGHLGNVGTIVWPEGDGHYEQAFA